MASSLKNESALKVVGKVCERESKNMNIPTGEIEIEVEEGIVKDLKVIWMVFQ